MMRFWCSLILHVRSCLNCLTANLVLLRPLIQWSLLLDVNSEREVYKEQPRFFFNPYVSDTYILPLGETVLYKELMDLGYCFLWDSAQVFGYCFLAGTIAKRLSKAIHCFTWPRVSILLKPGIPGTWVHRCLTCWDISCSVRRVMVS